MKYIFLTLILILTGCASSFFDRDQADPLYHDGRFAKRPMSAEEFALRGVIASGISLAMNKDYYHSSYLSGHCRCTGTNEPDFEIPCGTLTVVLNDKEGREVSRLTSDDGEFVFAVEKGTDYQVHAYSPFYIGRYSQSGSLKMGDSVVLQLTERNLKTGE